MYCCFYARLDNCTQLISTTDIMHIDLHCQCHCLHLNPLSAFPHTDWSHPWLFVQGNAPVGQQSMNVSPWDYLVSMTASGGSYYFLQLSTCCALTQEKVAPLCRVCATRASTTSQSLGDSFNVN